MIKELSIKNFRSIREATLELGRFTVLTGANNSGKSGVLYALQVLKNVVTNPNRSVDELLNLGFLNLGGTKDIVHKDSYRNRISLSISAVSNSSESTIDLTLSDVRESSELRCSGIKPYQYSAEIFVSFPYSLNKKEIILTKDGLIKFSWNGLTGNFLWVSDELYRISAHEYQTC